MQLHKKYTAISILTGMVTVAAVTIAVLAALGILTTLAVSTANIVTAVLCAVALGCLITCAVFASKSEYAKSKAEIVYLRATNAELTRQNGIIGATPVDFLHRQIAEKDVNIAALREQLAAKDAEIGDLHQEVKALAGTLEALRQRVDANIGQTEALKQALQQEGSVPGGAVSDALSQPINSEALVVMSGGNS
jgi:septal ring factor EnvC (AmiA/AmiB activator)